MDNRTLTGERRISERVQAKLEARWEGVLSSRTGIVVDVSSSGCFILTRDDVRPDELVRLEMVLPTGRHINLWGEVVYAVAEMGFALHFTGTEKTERQMLELLLDYLRTSSGAPPISANSTLTS